MGSTTRLKQTQFDLSQAMIKFDISQKQQLEYNLAKSLELLRMLNLSKPTYSINEIIELHNILRFIKLSLPPNFWSQKEKEEFVNFGPFIEKILDTYFEKINEENLIEKTTPVISMYISDFVDLFVRYRLYRKVSNQQFMDLMRANKIDGRKLLNSKQLVKTYPRCFKNIVRTNKRNRRTNSKRLIVKHLS